MIYDGKKASLQLQKNLKGRVALLQSSPVLAVLSASTHPSIASFIKIKRKFADAIGVEMREYAFQESVTEEELIKKIEELVNSKECDAIIVQLPLPASLDVTKILDSVPKEYDVDVLGKDARNAFESTGTLLPTVVQAIAHVLSESHVDLHNKKIVVVGKGKLVGVPIAIWLRQQGVLPQVIDINTDELTRLSNYKEADIVISGIGSPHHLHKEYFKNGVVLIDAGTSEQSGVLAGDCDPSCRDIASVFTPVPGGVGPLTVAYLFENVLANAEAK